MPRKPKKDKKERKSRKERREERKARKLKEAQEAREAQLSSAPASTPEPEALPSDPLPELKPALTKKDPSAVDPTPIWKGAEADTKCPFIVESWTRANPVIYLCTQPEVCKNSNQWVIRCAGCPYRPKNDLEGKIPIQEKPDFGDRGGFSDLPSKERIRAMVEEEKTRERRSKPKKERGVSARGIAIEAICSGLKGKNLEEAISVKLKEAGLEGKKIVKLIRSANRAIKKKGLVIKDIEEGK